MGYIGMCRREGYGFQAVYSGIGQIREFGSRRGYHFPFETDQLAEVFSLDLGNWELPLKNRTGVIRGV